MKGVQMSQISFAEAEYENKRRKTRRELFLEEIDQLIPWKKLESQVKRHYAKGKTGRPPYALSVMLRIHCLQLIYNYSDRRWKTRCMRLSPCGALRGCA